MAKAELLGRNAMNLGWFELSLDVNDFDLSCAFYEKLGFEVVDRSDEGRHATVQRGNCRLGLYQGRSPETVLLFWQGDVPEIARDLKDKGLTFERDPAPEGKGAGALLRDPDGLAIYLINIRGEARSGPPFNDDRKLGWFVTNVAVKNLEQSVTFYETLGFRRRPGADPDGVAMLSKDDCSIGLYRRDIIEPDTFQLTFWQGDVTATCAEFAANGLSFLRGPDCSERGVSAVLRDPDDNIIHLISESQ